MIDESNGDESSLLSMGAIGLAGLAAAGAIEGMLVEPNRLAVTRHVLEIPGLPERLDGWTVAHVTDLHLGRVRGAHRKVLQTLREVEPDLTVCTGDLVESTDDVETFESYGRRLVETSDRIVSVLGNWERRAPRSRIRALRRAYDRTGIPVLANEWTHCDGIAIAGGDDPATGHFAPAVLFDDPPSAPVRLFLVHAPIVLEGAQFQPPAFDLVLSGHTHGGQIRIGSFAPITPPGSGRFVSGFYDTVYGPAYVSRGIGMTRLRIRLMCLPELPIFEFRRTAGTEGLSDRTGPDN